MTYQQREVLTRILSYAKSIDLITYVGFTTHEKLSIRYTIGTERYLFTRTINRDGSVDRDLTNVTELRYPYPEVKAHLERR